MTDTVKIAIQGDSKGLVTAAKAGDKALDGLGDQAKVAGRELDGMGREAAGAERNVDRLGSTTEKSTRNIARMARATESLQTTGRIMNNVSEKVVGRMTALAGGAGIVMATKQAVEFNDELTQMGIAARDAQGEVNGKDFGSWFSETKKKIMDVSLATGQSGESLAAGMRAIVQRTGNMSQAIEEVELLGQAATASGSSVEELGALASNLDQKAGIKNVDQMRQAITLMVSQGKTGAFEMKDMISQGERLFTTMPNFRVAGLEGLKSFGAFVQMSRTFNGNAETAAESIVSLGTAVAKLDAKKLAAAGIHGLKTTNSDGSKRTTEDVIKDIIKRTKGDMDKLIKANVFDEPAQRLVNGMANLYAKGEGFKLFDSFKNAGGDLSKNNMMMEDFSTRIHDSKLQTDILINTLRKVADNSIAGPLAGMTHFFEWVNKHGPMTETVIKSIGVALLNMAAIVGATKFIGALRDIGSMFPRNGSRSIQDVAKGITGNGSPVFVTNWPGGMGASGSSWQRYGTPQIGRDGKGVALPTGALSRFSRMDMGLAGVGVLAASAENFATQSGSSAAWGQFGLLVGAGIGMWFGGPAGAMIGTQIGQMAGVAMGGYLETAQQEAAQKHKDRKYSDSRVVFDSGNNPVSSRYDRYSSEAISKRMSDYFDNTDHSVSLAKKAETVEVPKSFFDEVSAKDSKGNPITLNITNQVDAMGRTATTVSGSGASNIQVSGATLVPGFAR